MIAHRHTRRNQSRACSEFSVYISLCRWDSACITLNFHLEIIIFRRQIFVLKVGKEIYRTGHVDRMPGNMCLWVDWFMNVYHQIFRYNLRSKVKIINPDVVTLASNNRLEIPNKINNYNKKDSRILACKCILMSPLNA